MNTTQTILLAIVSNIISSILIAATKIGYYRLKHKSVNTRATVITAVTLGFLGLCGAVTVIMYKGMGPDMVPLLDIYIGALLGIGPPSFLVLMVDPALFGGGRKMGYDIPRILDKDHYWNNIHSTCGVALLLCALSILGCIIFLQE